MNSLKKVTDIRSHRENRFLALVKEDERLGGSLGITSKQIAKALGKRHDNVMQVTRKQIDLLNFKEINVPVESTYVDASGRTYPEFGLFTRYA